MSLSEYAASALDTESSIGSLPSAIPMEEDPETNRETVPKEQIYLPESPTLAKRKSATSPPNIHIAPAYSGEISNSSRDANLKTKKESKVDMMKRIFKFSSLKARSNDSLPGSPSGSGANTPSEQPSSVSSLQSITDNPGEIDVKNYGPKKAHSLLRKLSNAIVLGAGGRRKSRLSQVSSAMPEFDIDPIIARLKLNIQDELRDKCSVTVDEILYICREARALTMLQPILLEMNAPINICGDIHGQFTDLLTLFELCGDPADTNYLFLGDYVDRGKQSLETILLLMCYKIKYPETFFLLRGNHECASINRGNLLMLASPNRALSNRYFIVYGFYDECKRRSKLKVWKMFTDYFDVLPLAAIISGIYL